MAPTASRVRTSFDPEHELPRLHQWFAENPHPSRLTLQMYVKELNSLPSRQSRKLLEVHNLCYWFKNARAAYKRAEMRMKRESAEPNHAAANSSHPHHHFSCQPHSQQPQYQQLKPNSHQLANNPILLQQNHHNQQNDSQHLPTSSSSSPSPSGSPPSSLEVGGPLVGVDAELAALKLAAAAAAANLSAVTVVPPAAVANLTVAASLKSLLAATSRSGPPVLQRAPVPPLAPFSELDTDRSLYLLLFFMKIFDLDSAAAAAAGWQSTNKMTQQQQ